MAVPLVLGLTGCSDDEEPVGPADSGRPLDLGAGTPDGGEPEDGGAPDAGGGMDASAEDMGSTDGGGIDPSTEPYRTLSSTGLPAERIDLVFIGDGYTVDELDGAYEQHVEHLTDRMFTRRLNGATEPFWQFRSLFNVHRVHLASEASGIDEPSNGQAVDTPLDGTTVCGDVGTICLVDAAKARAAVDAALADTDITPDLIVVTLNTAEPVEGAIVDAHGRFAIYGGGPTDDDDVETSERGLRQIARAMAGLALNDPGFGAYTGGEPMEANLTRSSTGAKWSAWVGFDAEGDDQGPVGAFEGGGGFSVGVYRPVGESKLTGEYPGPFDPVAREAIIHAMFEIVPAIVSSTPSSGTLTNPDFIDAIPAGVSLVDIEWYVDGVDTEVRDGRFGFFPWAQFNGLSAGLHTVEARYRTRTVFPYPDCRRCARNPTDFVRRPSADMVGTLAWQVLYTP